MNRRNFLGWIGATSGAVAVYKDVVVPSSLEHLPDANLSKLADKTAGTYVVINESTIPMVVHYKRLGGALHVERPSHHAVHVSTVLLPGEELTITAVPAKV